jgi:hypothetical protein
MALSVNRWVRVSCLTAVEWKSDLGGGRAAIQPFYVNRPTADACQYKNNDRSLFFVDIKQALCYPYGQKGCCGINAAIGYA